MTHALPRLRRRASGSSRLLLAAAVLVLLVLPAGATAADCPKTTLAAVEADVMCPVCGTPLGLATEAPQANRQRALIQRLVDRCRSKEEIEEVLVAQYGPGVLALPEAEGFQLSAYLVPALIVLLAAGGIALAARRWRGRGGGPAAPGADGPAEDGAAGKRLDADLERYEL
ncbi:MAG TPA: cytochrome c-type biogenesis protein CcmH [Thermoleophilaceae bacterium]|nr:cytochrome c-type biogenesis protein CcmH [Thermoleophilaceae bacterium]